MAEIIRQGPRVSQPPAGTAVNPAWAPAAAWAFTGLGDSVSGRSVVLAAVTTFKPTTPGLALSVAGLFGARATLRVKPSVDMPGANDFTVVFRGIYRGAGSTTQSHIGRWNTGASPGTNDWLLGGSNTDNSIYFLVEVGSTSYSASVVAPAYLAGHEYVMVGRRRGTMPACG